MPHVSKYCEIGHFHFFDFLLGFVSCHHESLCSYHCHVFLSFYFCKAFCPFPFQVGKKVVFGLFQLQLTPFPCAPVIRAKKLGEGVGGRCEDVHICEAATFGPNDVRSFNSFFYLLHAFIMITREVHNNYLDLILLIIGKD